MADLGKKISELQETTDLAGLYTIGSDKNSQSKKVSLQFLKEAADFANAQGDYAKEVGDTVAGNVGVNAYPTFSASTQYAAGSVVNYNGKLYRFTSLHPAGAWVGTDAVLTSIKAEADLKLTELESEVKETERNVLNEVERVVAAVDNIKPIVINGNVTNAADEEDITSEDNLLKLKDRAALNGMGYVILRKNKTFAEQVTKANTIYEIRYNYDLNGSTHAIPTNCILKFIGGCISNGELIGNETQIEGSMSGILDAISISGTWNIPELHSTIFRDLSSPNALRNLFSLTNDNYNKVVIAEGVYQFDLQENYESAITLRSNTDVILNGTLQILPNRFPNYHVFECKGVANIRISGNGKIVGDLPNHKYSEWEYESTHEWGYGILLHDDTYNITIDGIEIYDFTGDGIVPNGSNHKIENCKIHDCRRQGISISMGDHIDVSKCEIYKIYASNGTPPGAAVDVEPNSPDESGCHNITICNNYFHDCNYGVLSFSKNYKITNLVISNNTIDTMTNCCIAIDFIRFQDVTRLYDNITICNNRMSNADYKELFIACVDKCIVENNIIQAQEGKTQFPILLTTLTNASFNGNIISSQASVIEDVLCFDGVFENNHLVNTNAVAEGVKSKVRVRFFPSDNTHLSEIMSKRLIIKGNVFDNTYMLPNYDATIQDNIYHVTGTDGSYMYLNHNICFKGNVFYIDASTYYNNPLIEYVPADGAEIVFESNTFQVTGTAYRILYCSVGNCVHFNNNVFRGNSTTNYIFAYPYKVNGTDVRGDFLSVGTTGQRPTLTRDEIGFIYFDYNLDKPILWNGARWSSFDGMNAYKNYGETSARPSIDSVFDGFQYFDFTLGKPIWKKGNSWIDASGTTV